MSVTPNKYANPIRFADLVQGVCLPQNTRLDSADRENITVREGSLDAEHRLLRRTVAAVPVESNGADYARIGPVQQLAAGIRVRVCGPGLDQATVLVESQDHGQFYIVFRADLNDSQVIASRPI